MSNHQDYSEYHNFIETFSKNGFSEIDSNHSVMLDLELLTEKFNQFFYIGDLVHLKVLFTSKRSTQMIGVEPKDVSPYMFMNHTHPDDQLRFNNARAKLIKMGQELFVSKEKFALLSTTIKMQNATGGYSNFLNQIYLFYSSTHNTVFFLKIHTNVDWCKKIKNGYYYYTGNDLTHFKYPNKEMLNMGGAFTNREFEIIKLIGLGMSTEQIAKKLFLSPYTINTHRVNILRKSGKTNISELIFTLMSEGII
jgi:DNA-binding CsgD family transcriptional regulator